jgi:predicted kinase
MKIKIMRGVSGSGKSTWAKQFAREALDRKEFPLICSADEYFMIYGNYQFDPTKLGEAHKYCLLKFMQAIKDKMNPIIVDNTNINIEDVAPYIAIGEAHNYDVEIVQIDVDYKLAAARNIHSVPDKSVKNMYERLRRIQLPKRWKQVYEVRTLPDPKQ